MGMMARFERRLQGAVDGVFARAFGGNVMPQEVEAALQREATDKLRQLEGGHLLAPNSYVITVNESDHAQLAADRDLAVRAFSRHLEDYLNDQGWQTYGEVIVEFEPSPTLHTGQFSTRGRVDPDARRPAPAPAGQGPAPQHQPVPSAPPQPGAGPMTQNSGYDPSREDPSYDPRRGWQDDQRGYGQQPQPAGRPGYQNGAYPPAEGGGQYGAPGGRPYQQNGGSYPDQRGGGQGYNDPAYGGGQNYQGGYQDQGYQDQGGYNGGAQGYDQGYADQGYQEHGQGNQQGYQDQQYGGQAYQQGYQDQGYQDQGGYGGQDQGGYGNQQGYQDQQYPAQQPGYGGGQQYADDQYGQPAYGQAPPADPGYAAPAPNGYGAGTYTATLQLDDGSGRTYQLREGSNIIGRGQDAHFRLPDTGVSRRHIEVRWDGQVAMLSDLGSTNGTLVNGAPVQDWQLADGDIVRAGHSEILIRIV